MAIRRRCKYRKCKNPRRCLDHLQFDVKHRGNRFRVAVNDFAIPRMEPGKAERLGGQTSVSGHDLQCVRRVHKVDDDPMFSYQAQHSPRKYTEAYVDWLVSKHAEDPKFFQHARELVRARTT